MPADPPVVEWIDAIKESPMRSDRYLCWSEINDAMWVAEWHKGQWHPRHRKEFPLDGPATPTHWAEAPDPPRRPKWYDPDDDRIALLT